MVSKGSLHGKEEDDELHFPFSNSLVWIWEMKKQGEKGRNPRVGAFTLSTQSSKKKKKKGMGSPYIENGGGSLHLTH